MNTWIHEHPDWPHFKWDDQKITPKLIDLRHKQGYLLGRMDSLGFNLKQDANLQVLIKDVITTSAIEGERLDKFEVRSSISRRLGLDVGGLTPSSFEVDGVVEMMLDATQNAFEPLTNQRLFDWQKALFPARRSGMIALTFDSWRPKQSGKMQVVSGAFGMQTVHYEAPEADRLEDEMDYFIQWFNSSLSIDPVLKAAIAHFWFVSIHPFEDGNGRIARALSDMTLARADGIQYRFYSVSSQIQMERKDYYLQLESQQRATPDITEWLLWFLGCMERSIDNADETLNHILYKADLWKLIRQESINERQETVLNRMMDPHFKGFMNTSKYAKLAKCSTDTALRDIQQLKSRGILIQNTAGGRSTSYRLPDSLDEG
jgi:Fic family protein